MRILEVCNEDEQVVGWIPAGYLNGLQELLDRVEEIHGDSVLYSELIKKIRSYEG